MSGFSMAVLQNLAAVALGADPPRPATVWRLKGTVDLSFLCPSLAGLQRNPERSGREPDIILIIAVYSHLFISVYVFFYIYSSWLRFV